MSSLFSIFFPKFIKKLALLWVIVTIVMLALLKILAINQITDIIFSCMILIWIFMITAPMFAKDANPLANNMNWVMNLPCTKEELIRFNLFFQIAKFLSMFILGMFLFAAYAAILIQGIDKTELLSSLNSSAELPLMGPHLVSDKMLDKDFMAKFSLWEILSNYRSAIISALLIIFASVLSLLGPGGRSPYSTYMQKIANKEHLKKNNRLYTLTIGFIAGGTFFFLEGSLPMLVALPCIAVIILLFAFEDYQETFKLFRSKKAVTIRKGLLFSALIIIAGLKLFSDRLIDSPHTTSALKFRELEFQKGFRKKINPHVVLDSLTDDLEPSQIEFIIDLLKSNNPQSKKFLFKNAKQVFATQKNMRSKIKLAEVYDFVHSQEFSFEDFLYHLKEQQIPIEYRKLAKVITPEMIGQELRQKWLQDEKLRSFVIDELINEKHSKDESISLLYHIGQNYLNYDTVAAIKVLKLFGSKLDTSPQELMELRTLSLKEFADKLSEKVKKKKEEQKKSKKNKK